MKERNVGRSGLKVSVLGLGCNNFGGRCDAEATRKVIHKALDLGITLFDTADIYPMGDAGVSEELIGQFLGARRNDIVLATKFGGPMGAGKPRDSSRRYIISAVEDSLRRLKTDWIDLYQVHFLDPRTPVDETLRALDDLVRQGKVRYIGCSNFPAWRVVDAQWTARELKLNGFICCQDEYSLAVRDVECELIPAIQSNGLGLLPFFPLASGLLTGKYRKQAPLPQGARLSDTTLLAERFLSEANYALAARLEAFAAKQGHNLLELAFSWLLAQPVVPSVIAGATRPEQLEQNAKSVDWVLSAEELAEVDRLRQPVGAV